MPDITDNDIVSWVVYQNSMTANLYAAAGGSLTNYGEKRVSYLEITLKHNRTPHAKDTGARAGCQDTRAETSRTGIVEVGYFYYLSTATAHGSRPAALRARESRHGGTHERGREYKKAKYNERK